MFRPIAAIFRLLQFCSKSVIYMPILGRDAQHHLAIYAYIWHSLSKIVVTWRWPLLAETCSYFLLLNTTINPHYHNCVFMTDIYLTISQNTLSTEHSVTRKFCHQKILSTEHPVTRTLCQQNPVNRTPCHQNTLSPEHFVNRTLSPEHSVNRTLCYQNTLSTEHSVNRTLSPEHSVNRTLSPEHCVNRTLSPEHTVTRTPCQQNFVTRTLCQQNTVTRTHCHQNKLSPEHSVTRTFCPLQSHMAWPGIEFLPPQWQTGDWSQYRHCLYNECIILGFWYFLVSKNIIKTNPGLDSRLLRHPLLRLNRRMQQSVTHHPVHFRYTLSPSHTDTRSTVWSIQRSNRYHFMYSIRQLTFFLRKRSIQKTV